jgi:riboflavin kinase / FMN adenylyltransferase
VWITSLTSKALTPNAIALGNFDGIHLGHRQVVQPILHQYKNIQYKDTIYQKTLVTFNPHPQEFFSGESKKLLTPIEEKAQQLELLGIDQLILLPFDRELASLSPENFVENILIKELKATFISVGEDFRFGCQRAGTAKDLKFIASRFGVNVHIATLKTDNNNMRISSSEIRKALSEGEIEAVTRFLGYSYPITGKVITGEKLGRKIGFPTANLQVSPFKLMPRQGVYGVKVFLHQKSNYSPLESNWQEKIFSQGVQYFPNLLSIPIKGVMNIGNRPTVNGQNESIEVHLLNWEGDLYGQNLTVSLEKFLRPEQKFSSLEELKKQIALDCEKAHCLWSRNGDKVVN